VERPGEESLTGAIAAQAIEAQLPFGQIKPRRGRVVRASNSILGRRHGERRMLRTRGRAFQAKEKKLWRTEGTSQRSDQPAPRATLPAEHESVWLVEADRSKRDTARVVPGHADERSVTAPMSNHRR
jgi:hypothetical protein